jgi:hypothetical protein
MGSAILIIAWGTVLASLFLVADMVAVDLATRRVERIALRRTRGSRRDEPRH